MLDPWPFDAHTLLTYSVAAFALVLAPGPGQALVITRSVEGGVRSGVLTSIGLEIGTLIHTLAAALGLSVIFATSATAFALVKYAGAAYLVVLGVRMLWRARGSGYGQELGGGGNGVKGRRLVVHGAMTGILNPKVAVFLLAFLPRFVHPERASLPARGSRPGGSVSPVSCCSVSACGWRCPTIADPRPDPVDPTSLLLHSIQQAIVRARPADRGLPPGGRPERSAHRAHGGLQMQTRIDHLTGGIHRISTWMPQAGITFNQFLIDDDRPALIHTGEYGFYQNVRAAIAEVLDPARLAFVALLHWEGDKNGGMDRFLADASGATLVGSSLSIQLNARGFGVVDRVRGFQDGDTLDLGRHTLRFLETPHLHHWDSMMVVEEATRSLFPADLFLQPGDQPPVVEENLAEAMCEAYRQAGIFGHEDPVRQVVERIAQLDPDWVHAMHGGSLTRAALPRYVSALRSKEFAYRGTLLGRELPTAAGRFPMEVALGLEPGGSGIS